jgi:crossover junction endodeoxyribonuclease RusA
VDRWQIRLGSRAITSFVVFGRPVPKARPRFYVRNGKNCVFTPRQTQDFEAKVARAARLHFPSPLEGPVHVTIDAYWAAKASSNDTERQWRPVGEDLDNVVKAILDGLNKVAWNDDRQVVSITARKWYSSSKNIARTEVTIERINGEAAEAGPKD